jgi:mRNA interferase YafQ
MMSTEAEPPPLDVVTTSRYEKDAKRIRKRDYDITPLIEIVDPLRHRRPLGARHPDHALKGMWKGWRDCHVKDDWVLIYKVDAAAGELVLGRTGTHADLFGD